MLIKEDYKINQFSPNTNYIPDNEASIIQSLKSLYDSDPDSMLYKVIIKKDLNFFIYIYNLINTKNVLLFLIGMDESISL